MKKHLKQIPKYKKPIIEETSKPLSEYLDLSEEDTQEVDIVVLKKIFGENVLKYDSIYDFTNNETIKKIRNKICSVNSLDFEFEKAVQYGWQEVFKFKEERDDRKIVVLDVNSQYPHTMVNSRFSDPSKMYARKVRSFEDVSHLDNGIVLVSFDIKDVWFEKIFPRYFFDLEGRKYFRYSQLDYIWLHIEELRTYLPYITNIKLKKVIYSKKSIDHPLKNTINYFYRLRREYAGTVYEKIIKKFLVCSHSTTNPRIFTTETISCDNSTFLEAQERLYQRGIIIKNPEELKFVPNILEDQLIVHSKSGRYIPSIVSSIYSQSRIGLFKILSLIHNKLPEVDICYINIDSLHFSVPSKIYEDFICFLENEGIIGERLGQFKIEAQGDKGYWFCPGRYFIISKDKITKYADISLRNENFLFNLDKYEVVQTKKFTKSHRHVVTSGNNFKYLNGDDFIRPFWGEPIRLNQYRFKNNRIKKYIRYLKRTYSNRI